MNDNFILAIDQGTSGTKSFIFDSSGQIVTGATAGLNSYFPKPGFVEQDPEEIYQNVLASVNSCLKDFDGRISACGISNQRETFILWDASGKPISNAIVWQCRRTAPFCDELKHKGWDKRLKAKTGLVTDAYFSGTKVKWILENHSAEPLSPSIQDHVRGIVGAVDEKRRDSSS